MRGIRRCLKALRTFFLAPFHCFHPLQVLRRDGSGQMGVSCYKCGRWLGPINADRPGTRVAAELAARQAVARNARRTREGQPPKGDPVDAAAKAAFSSYATGFRRGIELAQETLVKRQLSWLQPLNRRN